MAPACAFSRTGTTGVRHASPLGLRNPEPARPRTCSEGRRAGRTRLALALRVCCTWRWRMRAGRRTDGTNKRDDGRRGHGPHAQGVQGRADVRHGRVPAAGLLRRRAAPQARPPPHQRRALRCVRRRCLCQGVRPRRPDRRHAGPRRHQPGHGPGGGAQRGIAGRRLHRRHQPPARRQEHDAGHPAGRHPAPRVQGAAAHRGRAPHPRADPPRLPRRHLGAAGPGGGGGAGGYLPRHAAFRRGGVRRRCALRGGARHPLPAGGRRPAAGGETAGRSQAAADAVRRRRAHLDGGG